MNKQIVKNIKNINLISYQHNDEIIFDNINEIPFISYPNGNPCHIINSYIINLSEKNRSIYTIKQKANNLSHLVKYCFYKKIKFINFKEADLISLSNFLINEKKENNQLKRTKNTVIDIVKSILDFMAYFGDLNGDTDFIYNQIGAKKKNYNILLKEYNGKITKEGWIHKAIPLSDPKKIRTPISKKNIDKLYEAILNINSSKYLKQRRIQMLKLLENTGARAGEIALLKVSDVQDALNNSEGLIKLHTLKKKENNSIRFIPITQSDLNSLNKFIKIYREKIIKNTIGKSKDQGFVFINEKTGKTIIPATISNELAILRNYSNIETKVCAHMFRHRFITKLFVKLIKQYNYENPDSFRMALLDINSLKQKIQQFTGHTKLSSLDIYIDLAFDEITNINIIKDKIDISNIYESYDKNSELLLKELESGLINLKEYTKRQKELMNIKNKELSKND